MSGDRLTPLGQPDQFVGLHVLHQMMRDFGPMEDGVFLDLLPTLAPLAPTEPPAPAPKRAPRPLAVRIQEEETRLYRRRLAHAAAVARLARVTVPTVPDHAAAMLRASDAHRQNARMDGALRRYVEASDNADRMWSRVVSSQARLDRLREAQP